MLNEELGPDGFVLRDAVPTSDVIRIRFADIDGLRALAICAVVFAAVVGTMLPGYSPMLERAASEATQGLTLFLVLSGFTLAFPVLAMLRQDGRTYLDVGRFAIRRLLRVYPTYVAIVAGSAVVGTFATWPLSHVFVHPKPGDVFTNLLFVGDGFGNPGLRAVQLFLRAYLAFPALVWLWTRRPQVFVALAAALAALDVLTPAHAWGIAAFTPFMLGIVAADLRAARHRLERIAPLVTALGAALAIVCGPTIATLAGASFAPAALRIDPFWAVCAFGLVVSVGSLRPLEHLFSFWMFRVIGAAAYSISLVVVPVCASLAVASRYGSAFAIPAVLIAGFALWQLVDRWFSDETFRRSAAMALAIPLDDVLRIARADRVFFGVVAEAASDEPDLDAQEEFVPSFYAPPPRSTAADLAIVSRRTGSPQELAAEILETKARLLERSAAFFADAAPSPAPASAPAVPVFAKPGIYRRSVPGSSNAVSAVPALAAHAYVGNVTPPEPKVSAQGIRLRIAQADGAHRG